ncbi:acyl-CoA-binding protein [Dendryphion nanum]|uniref:Acyl-CoA-binding protein n=1 Tax=Dendryphion nanum TaxID=256645 RepID=A0A9P9IHX2_9PLEO|nr:acyl-CoA-binding protein [Dendryphion nanum]
MSRTTSDEFNKLWDELPNLKEKPTQDEQLSLYAYGKIAKGADFSEAKKPGMMDFAGKYKYNKWESYVKEEITPEVAEEEYIKLANELIERIGTK